jgi:putative polyhydroxyalkanoate system protein
MGKSITMNIPHTLGRAEARHRLADGFTAMRQQMTGGLVNVVSFQEHWEGDQLHFEGGGLGQTIRGRLHVLDDAVQIEIELPALLAAIAGRISSQLKTVTSTMLEDRRDKVK